MHDSISVATLGITVQHAIKFMLYRRKFNLFQ